MSEKQKSQLKKRYAKIVDYKRCFTSEEGRRVLLDLMNEHWMLSPTFHEDGSVRAFRDGERNVVLRILKYLNVGPEQMQAMIEEIEKDVRNGEHGSSGDGDGGSRIRW